MDIPTHEAQSHFIEVDGIRTHYLEAGTGPTVVMLHAGGFGESGQLSWEYNIGAFAEHFRLVIPDWLGFGQTDKLRDFVDGNGRMLRHMARFCQVMEIHEADFVGSSMGATFMLKSAVGQMQPMLQIRRMVLSSGGGFSPMNEARKILQDYDCTVEGMRQQLRQVFHSTAWADDDEYVQRKYELSLEPGAWEFAASARFRSPAAPELSDFGNKDMTPYENVSVPALFTAGADDKLREPGYAEAIAERNPLAEAITYPDCGHCPHIEKAKDWTPAALEFLLRP